MKHAITICYITSRQEPKVNWLIDSLAQQVFSGDHVEFIVVDGFSGTRTDVINVNSIKPKPTVWQGEHRLTRQDHWAASNSRNTGICLCRTPWIAFLDDRSVLLPTWLQAVRHAMDDNYAVFGTYEKVSNLVVERGLVKSFDPFPNNSGKDSRSTYVAANKSPIPFDCGGEWAFGCTLALPLEWVLSVGGYDETCDGLSMEDVVLGLHLQNNHFPLKFDPRMSILEDRTPGQLGQPMKREDKGISPNDKSHALLAMLKDRKTAMHGFDIREVRRKVLAGEPWPKPWAPTVDFFDGQPVSEMI